MSQSCFTTCEMRATLPATSGALEAFIADFRLLRGCFQNTQAPFVAELLLREVLVNAAEHGCHSEPARRVHCKARLRGNALTIAVTDEGDGFDWRAAWRRPADPLGTSGRGLEILRACGTRVRFNQKGNRIVVCKRF